MVVVMTKVVVTSVTVHGGDKRQYQRSVVMMTGWKKP